MIHTSSFPYINMREQQSLFINKVNNVWDNDDIKYIVAQLPTGFGKSPVAVSLAKSCKKSFILTATKQLQDQYVKDFKRENLKSIKGKVNYKCGYNEKLNCEIGPCLVNKKIFKDCKRDMICPYYNARLEANNAHIMVTSYQYFLRAGECAGWLRSRDVLILDECHLLEGQITQWASFCLQPIKLHDEFKIFEGCDAEHFIYLCSAPQENGYEKNKIWLSKIWDLIVVKRLEKYEEIKNSLNGKDPDELTEEELDELASTHKGYYELDKLYKRLSVFFKSQNKDQWIIEPYDGGLMIQPINTGLLFKQYLDKWAIKKVVFMSATILDINGFCSELGLEKHNTVVVKMESQFPPEKSPIVYYPVGSMSYKNIDNTVPKIIESVKTILKQHPNDKGIIHTSNYKLAKIICESIDNDRLIMKDLDGNNEKLIKKHTISKHPTVLVSPSLTTGADLKDDLSRFQIILKLPWGSLMDKRVKKKIEINGDWYVADMFRSLIQACGRSTRSEKDWSVTYILDNSFYSWIFKYKQWLPQQFLKRIIWKKSEYFKNKGDIK